MTQTPPITQILEKIANSKANSQISAASITLLAASKGQPIESIELAIAEGVRHFGENRVQETMSKWPALKQQHPDITLHLIGPLQTNKVREALQLFDVIQTVDRPKLALALVRGLENLRTRELEKKTSNPRILESSLPRFYIQINTGEEPQKAGVSPGEANDFIRYCKEFGLNVVGLMCVPPADQPCAPHFALLRKLAVDNGLSELSMGMSGDFGTAIRMGSTCVRLGTALFGERGG
jgi:pyridoxal phosphate enzyme (YggS family)